MKAKRGFSAELLATLHQSKGLRIRAGTGRHRFIGIWVVVAKDGVFVRSWSAIRVGNQEIAIRAVRRTNKRLRDSVDRAYLDKYNSPGSLKYAKDLRSAKSRATTIELLPWLSRLPGVRRFYGGKPPRTPSLEAVS